MWRPESADHRNPKLEAAAHLIGDFLAAAPFGLLIVGRDLRCLTSNASFGGLVRETYDEARISGRSLPPLKAAETDAFERALAGEVVVLETDSPPLVGVVGRSWRLYFLPITAEDGLAVGVIFEDITEGRLATDAFQASEQRFRLLVDHAGDGILVHRARIVLYANAEAVRLLGYPGADELVGRSVDELLSRGPARSSEGSVEVTTPHDAWLIKQDGSLLLAECRQSSAPLDEGEAGFLFFRDVGERRRQTRRRELARRIESLSRLSTSLGAELMFLSARVRRWAARIGAQSETSEPASEGLLALADDMQQRAGDLEIENNAARRVVTYGRVATLAERLDAALTQPDAPTLNRGFVLDLVPTDSYFGMPLEPLIRSLVRLVVAADRASSAQAHPVHLAGRLRVTEDNPPLYVLSICAESAALSSPPRSAAGLPYSSWERGTDLDVLAALHEVIVAGGAVDVGVGEAGEVAFELELPLEQREPGRVGSLVSMQVAMASLTEVAPARDSYGPDNSSLIPSVEPVLLEFTPTTSAAPADPAGSPRILLCDDETRLTALTAGLLREYGYEVDTACSGREAVVQMSATKYEVVVLDVNLPGEDALEIARALVAVAPVVIVLSSGFAEEDVSSDLLTAPGVSAFLSKPFTVDVLVGTIERARAERRLSAGIQRF